MTSDHAFFPLSLYSLFKIIERAPVDAIVCHFAVLPLFRKRTKTNNVRPQLLSKTFCLVSL